MSALYEQTRESLVRLMQYNGYETLPLTGLDPEEVSLVIRKTGQNFQTKTLTPDSFLNKGDGWYVIVFDGSDMNSIGEFYFRITPTVEGGLEVEKYFDVVPPPLYTNPDFMTCIVTGNLVDVAGEAVSNAEIVFRPKNVPIIVGPSMIGSNIYRTTPDAFGNFSVKLLRNITVLVEIHSAGIRHIINVPDLPTADILSLLPPVPMPV